MVTKVFCFLRLTLLSAALAAGGFAQTPTADPAKQKPVQSEAPVFQSTRPTDPNLYAGTDTCVSCHDEIAATHEKGPHGKAELNNKGAALRGCEGCHGPGKAHAESGGDTSKITSFKNLTKTESTKICLDCHGQHVDHANFERSPHGKNNVGCVDCHSVHKARAQQRLLKVSQPQVCYGCHQNVKTDPSRPSHSQSKDEQVGCTNCHTPHGPTQSAANPTNPRGNQ